MFSHCTTAFYITGYSDRIPTSKKQSPSHTPKSELLAAALVPSGTLRERYRPPTPQTAITFPHPQQRLLGRASLFLFH